MKDLNSKIKMIALDLDGTALSTEKDFSKRTLSSFKMAIDKGVKIIIATGRAEESLPESIYRIEGLRYVITSNGARILDIIENRVIYENFIDDEAIDQIHEVLKKHDCNIEVFIDGRAYIGKREYDMVLNGEITTRSKEYVMWSRTPVDDIYALLLRGRDRVENINVNYTNLEQKALMEGVLKSIENVHLTSSVPLNNELGGKTTSKADALRVLMEREGILKEELMACGDNPNDLEMIKLAGIGIAMDNAEDIVKEQADYVTLSNEEDGVAFVIEKFI